MNLIATIANAKAAFRAMMVEHLGVDEGAWCLVGLDTDGSTLVFRCEDMTECWESLPFSLSVPGEVATFGAEALLAAARKDEQFLLCVRRMHDTDVLRRLGRKAEIEAADPLLTEGERQDRDSRQYVDYHTRLGVDPALL